MVNCIVSSSAEGQPCVCSSICPLEGWHFIFITENANYSTKGILKRPKDIITTPTEVGWKSLWILFIPTFNSIRWTPIHRRNDKCCYKFLNSKARVQLISIQQQPLSTARQYQKETEIVNTLVLINIQVVSYQLSVVFHYKVLRWPC